ncbi:asparagine synthase-related protein [Halorarius litoreus]|uniref:asparagine synthase-related protein n=1 Tax=Halorarius litoreus TaxID=2962676 RepID=UPI0020CC2E27|nr:asparagine synthase-related protein [Halorarius litoreus]
MVGLCGTVGEHTPHPAAFADSVRWRDGEVTETFTDDDLSLSTAFHPLLAGDQPARTHDRDALVWVWGDVYGTGSGDAYVAREGPSDGSARYCADLYDRFGLDFVTELNGDFGLVIYDREAETLSFVTDRVATRPFFYTRPTAETVVVASEQQALLEHPAVEPDLELDYLYEYLQLRRVFGIETPLSDVQEVPPGSVATVDLTDGSVSVTTYWRPHYEPVDESFESYVDRFADTFQTVLDEWTRDDLEYGVLLSGGSDSRLVQAAMDQSVTAYHIADWMSREATIAREAAEVAGDEFRLLQRGPDYDAEALERNPPRSNFSGWFDQAYFTGFADEIADEVDVLVSGLYADMLFGGGPLATRELSLGPIGKLPLPVRDPIESVDEYVSMQTTDAVEPLSYVTEERSIRDVVASNITVEHDRVVSHGVDYGSLRDLVMYGDFYPMGADTDANFSRSLMHMRPYRTPFLDNRLLDLQQQIPIEFLLRRDLVNRGVERLAPELAEIPHARTGMPLKHGFPLDFVGGTVAGFWRKHVTEEAPPADYLDHGPWPDRRALLRTQSFPAETLVERRALMEDLPFLDYEGALESYRNHVRGADESTVLYSLLTFLQMPVAEAVGDVDDETDGREPADHLVNDD